MKKFILLVTFLFISFGLWANNNINMGSIKTDTGPVSVIAREDGILSLSYGLNIINLNNESILMLKQYIKIIVELMNIVESENLTVEYKRQLGQLNSTNYKKIIILFYSGGNGLASCNMSLYITSMVNYEPSIRISFNDQQIKQLLDILDQSINKTAKINSEIVVLNAIVAKARDIQ